MRFFKGVRGDGYSFALGDFMPDNRRQRDKLAAEKGVYFDAGRTAQEQTLHEYREHVMHGGQLIDAQELLPPPPEREALRAEVKRNVMESWKNRDMLRG